MTCVVTGANGFIGSAIVRSLLAEGHAVRAMVRRDSDRRNLEGLGIEITEGDIRDPGSLERIMRGASKVFHTAADYRLWVPDPASMFGTNVDGSLNVIRSAAQAGVERIVYTSSVAVLGFHADGSPADEATPVSSEDMIGPYKRSKFEAELAVSRVVREEGAPVVIVNPATPIGPGDIKPTPTGRIIVDAAAGRMPAYVDTGLNVVHVDDVALGHLQACERGEVGQRYILGGDNMSLKQILACVALLVGRKPPRWRLPHAVVMPLAYASEALAKLSSTEPRVTLDGARMSAKPMYFRSAKARRVLGYAPRAAVSGIEDAVGWFRRHGYF